MTKIILLMLCLSGIDDAKQGEYNSAFEKMVLVPAHRVPKELHHQFYFYMAVSAHQLRLQEEALDCIKKFGESFDTPPVRYERILWGLEDDLKSWDDGNPLRDIERRMNEVAKRLDRGKAGPITQGKQQEIVDILDKMIKDIENPPNSGDGNGDGNDKDKQGKGQKPSKEQGSSPADDSRIMGSKPGEGKVPLDKELRQLAEKWGSLPPDKRARIMEDLNRDVPARYRPMVEEYFRQLNRMHRP